MKPAAVLRPILLLGLGAGVALLVLVALGRSPWSSPPPAAPAAPGAPKPLWTCGMHPQVLQDEPGTCPICHMELTPVTLAEGSNAAHGERRVLFYRDPADPMSVSPVPKVNAAGREFEPIYAEDEAPAVPEVTIDAGLIQRMNVTTAPVERKDLRRSLSTVGTIEFDHELETTVTVRYSGFVEHVHVHLAGEEVRRGQPLFDVYSPELVQTQQDLIAAGRYARAVEGAAGTSEDAVRRARELADAARERLRLWEISRAQVRRIEETGIATRVLTVSSPVSGVVTRVQEGLLGMEVTPGMSIYTIADTSRAWVRADVYEDQVPQLQSVGAADVIVDALGGERLRAELLAVSPAVEPQTRTVPVTLSLPNPGGKLRQGMRARIEFQPVTAQAVLVVPSDAILRTGRRDVAVVALGEGRFAPREVVLGAESGGVVEVRSGLSEGERVVTSAQFLIDSESSLRAAIQAMVAGHEGR